MPPTHLHAVIEEGYVAKITIRHAIHPASPIIRVNGSHNIWEDAADTLPQFAKAPILVCVREGREAGSFLKKRTKKLLILGVCRPGKAAA
jgi:hypothetical protein